MNNSNREIQTQNDFAARISEFVQQSSGLKIVTKDSATEASVLHIFQKVDSREFPVAVSRIQEVLNRKDSENKAFLQINFEESKKILVTDNLIGFKPANLPSLDLSKLPRVVTTPDIQSVVFAIEDTLSNETTLYEEFDVLRRVFESVLQGAEDVGFQMNPERAWLKRLMSPRLNASA